jgi:hypothetical protein
LFERHGIQSVIADPAELRWRDGALQHERGTIDLVYNRLIDFALATPPSVALREAYLQQAVVVTPHPRAHALYADKRNLALLSDTERLDALGVPAQTQELLLATIPRTRLVSRQDVHSLWSERRELFFKPTAGYGADDGEARQRLKFDLRNYAYDGQVQWVAARLYQGQTTNFRTPGGGFAPVYALA